MAFIKASKHGIFTLGTAVLLMMAPPVAFAKTKADIADSRKTADAVRSTAGAVQELPGSNSQMPLLSLLGLGMLSGGLISLMRTRPRTQMAPNC